MKRRRRLTWRRWTNPALLVGLAVVAVAGCWVLAPLGEPREVAPRRFAQPSIAESVQYRAMTALTATWFFFFGASVGSFLNVVVWRLPRGETLIWRSSRCPRCGAGIRAADNVPVFGWLRLRGRCRVCRTPISPRYPLVEFLTGALFLSLAAVELFLHGANLPFLHAGQHARSFWMLFEIRWELAVLYIHHMILLSVLLSWALIEGDRRRIPTGYVAFALFVGVLAPLAVAVGGRLVTGESISPILPRPLHPVPVMPVPWEWMVSIGWLNRFCEPAAGGAVGAACGVLLSPAVVGASHPPRVIAALAVVGVFLGWQAAVSIMLVAALVLPLAAACWPAQFERRLLGVVFTATVVHLFLWRPLDQADGWPGSETSPAGMVVFAAVAFLLAVAAGRIAQARRVTALA